MEPAQDAFAPAMAPAAIHECGTGLEDQDAVLGLRLAGLFALLVTAAIGGILPLLLKIRNLNALFFMGTCFAAGVVLATGFVHVLPDAVEAFNDPCLGFSENFPWAETVAGFSALVIFALETTLRSWVVRRTGASSQDINHSHSHGPSIEADPSKEGDPEAAITQEKQHAAYVREMDIIAIVLESGFVFHSIFVGIDLGISRESADARPLLIALLFHQGFEGLALGSQFMKAEYSVVKYTALMILFVLIAPVGVAIGIGMGDSYEPTSKRALACEAAFNSVSAGILIYNGLVDLAVPAFNAAPNLLPRNLLAQCVPYLFLAAGYCAMALLGKWA